MPVDCCKKSSAGISEEVPVFTLVAYDELAPAAIAFWIDLARSRRVNARKIAKARKHLDAVLDYQRDNPEKVKLPD